MVDTRGIQAHVEVVPHRGVALRHDAQRETGVRVVRARHMLFFFSSRRRHTRCSRDWSSDVCSSDLDIIPGELGKYQETLQWIVDRFRKNPLPTIGLLVIIGLIALLFPMVKDSLQTDRKSVV